MWPRNAFADPKRPDFRPEPGPAQSAPLQILRGSSKLGFEPYYHRSRSNFWSATKCITLRFPQGRVAKIIRIVKIGHAARVGNYAARVPGFTPNLSVGWGYKEKAGQRCASRPAKHASGGHPALENCPPPRRSRDHYNRLAVESPCLSASRGCYGSATEPRSTSRCGMNSGVGEDVIESSIAAINAWVPTRAMVSTG